MRDGAHERNLLRAIRIAVAKSGLAILWRNQVGEAVYRYRTATGERTYTVPYGLVTGASDLIGLLTDSGRFVALEVKTDEGNLREEQRLFIELVRNNNGFAAVVRSVDEALAALARARAGACA